MIKYAIISDIHGNLSALEAVFDDINRRKVDRIICLGDIISKGNHNRECLELIRKFADAVVKGNNDVKYSKSLDEIVTDESDFDYDYFYWTQKQLTSDDIQYLRHLPLCCEFKLSGRFVRCFHASPSNLDLLIYNFSSSSEKIELFKPTKNTTNNIADVVVYGHTHNMAYEKLYGRTLINVGSVGNSLNLFYDKKLNDEKINDFTMAEYVILSGDDGDNIGEISVEFVSVPYDKDAELNSFIKTDYKDLYAQELTSGEYRYPELIRKRILDNNA